MSKIFGRLPAGERLERVKKSLQYKRGQFVNQHDTPALTEDANLWKLLKAYRRKPSTVKPSGPMPAMRPDFSSLRADEPALIWFGHSSYYLQIEGLRILVDPVFSGKASPVPCMVRAFEGTDIISPKALPPLDYVLITHDHYDHMDYETLRQLKSKTGHWLTSLGVGEHLEYWGIPAKQITELDWQESVELKNACSITAMPSRHFSGRGLKRAQSLWSSFVLKTPHHTIYLGGDSGWDDHFAEIGRRFGPFDLAILECGQYNTYWKHIHMMPEETAAAAEALGAKKLLPEHWGKFVLSLHPWNEPIERLLKAAAGRPFKVLTPMIGQTLRFTSDEAYDNPWWRDVK